MIVTRRSACTIAMFGKVWQERSAIILEVINRFMHYIENPDDIPGKNSVTVQNDVNQL